MPCGAAAIAAVHCAVLAARAPGDSIAVGVPPSRLPLAVARARAAAAAGGAPRSPAIEGGRVHAFGSLGALLNAAPVGRSVSDVFVWAPEGSAGSAALALLVLRLVRACVGAAAGAADLRVTVVLPAAAPCGGARAPQPQRRDAAAVAVRSAARLGVDRDTVLATRVLACGAGGQPCAQRARTHPHTPAPSACA